MINMGNFDFTLFEPLIMFILKNFNNIIKHKSFQIALNAFNIYFQALFSNDNNFALWSFYWRNMQIWFYWKSNKYFLKIFSQNLNFSSTNIHDQLKLTVLLNCCTTCITYLMPEKNFKVKFWQHKFFKDNCINLYFCSYINFQINNTTFWKH